MAQGLSVLTLVKNRAGHLRQLVEGLRRSGLAPDELIVVDMGSAIPVAVDPLPWSVTILTLDADALPLAAARNLAASHARCNALLFLDVDCIPGGGLVAAMRAALEEQDALICAEIRYLGPQDARSTWTENDLYARGERHPVRDFPATGLRAEPNPGLFWSLAFGIRAARFQALRGFDERFTGYGAEDTDFGFRASAASLPLLFLGGTAAYHQHHEGFDPPLQHFADIIRNARTFYGIWGRWPMEGWLAAFARMGLIDWGEMRLDLIRHPTVEERDAARIAAP